MSAMHVGHKNGPREELTGEHPAGHAGQIIVACLFAVVWIGDGFFLGYTTQLNQYVPVAIRITLGVCLLIISVYLVKAGHEIAFEGKGGNSGVIRHGIYGWVRHPIYLSEIVFYLGLLMIRFSLVSFVVWIIAIGFFHYISRYEERLLLERFGEEYARYMREVSMWIPRRH